MQRRGHFYFALTVGGVPSESQTKQAATKRQTTTMPMANARIQVAWPADCPPWTGLPCRRGDMSIERHRGSRKCQLLWQFQPCCHDQAKHEPLPWDFPAAIYSSVAAFLQTIGPGIHVDRANCAFTLTSTGSGPMFSVAMQREVGDVTLRTGRQLS